MMNEFTSLIEKHEGWYIGFCPEVPKANGQGRTEELCRENLAEAIAWVFLDRREDALARASSDAVLGIVRVAA